MKKSIILFGILTALPWLSQAQVSFNGSYTENFDSLGPAGTGYPAGWSGVRYAGTGAIGPLTPGVTAGATNTGGLYNVGTAGDADRALGTLASGTTIPRFGLQLANNSGSTYDQITFSGVSEQWRTGNNATVNETASFEYSFNATDINDPVPRSNRCLRWTWWRYKRPPFLAAPSTVTRIRSLSPARFRERTGRTAPP